MQRVFHDKIVNRKRSGVMLELSIQQIRNYRLYAHHLDHFYSIDELMAVVGACGLQNTPPNAWESALFNRIPTLTLANQQKLLYEDKVLLQAWSLRGLPMIFPTSESDTFLSSLKAENNEEWIYTHGIQLALDLLQMNFDELLKLLVQVMPQLNHQVLISKNKLDETLAEWMLPLLSEDKKKVWIQPSMYGSADRQSIGGAVVSFLLRPCSFMGLVVFGERVNGYPTFTSYKNWTGYSLREDFDAAKQLVRKYLHCYGPSTVDLFVKWLGCSSKQGHRMWNCIKDEIEVVQAAGKRAYILKTDSDVIQSVPLPQRMYLMLSGHDPYLDQRDRLILQPDKAHHKEIWQTVSNPGALIYQGEIVGIWKSHKKTKGLEIEMKLWREDIDIQNYFELAKEYATFRNQPLLKILNIK